MSEQSVASARAAVLVYDDHNKKWVPSGTSSGLSKVHIYQHTVNGTFRIVGRKLHDHEVVINCAILKGLKYSQATGTFHQWRDNRTVYGLNFSSKDDADNFAVAMLRAIDMLNQNSSTVPRVQQAPPPVPQHASQPIYQTISSVAAQEDGEHQRNNWQNQQSVHYMATNSGELCCGIVRAASFSLCLAVSLASFCDCRKYCNDFGTVHFSCVLRTNACFSSLARMERTLNIGLGLFLLLSFFFFFETDFTASKEFSRGKLSGELARK